MINTAFYLDSKDASSLGFETSSDYLYCFLVQMPMSSIDDIVSTSDSDNIISSNISRYLNNTDIKVSWSLTDVLYYRFFLSMISLFSIHKHQGDVMRLLMHSLELVYDSISRDKILSLLDSPDIQQLEDVLDCIKETAIAADEVLSIKLISRIREIIDRLYEGESDAVFNTISSKHNVDFFPIMSKKENVIEIIQNNEKIIVCNARSIITSYANNIELQVEDKSVFKSINNFCTSIIDVFSSLLIKNEEGKDLNDDYSQIWSFILRTESSFFLPKSAIDKARLLLL